MQRISRRAVVVGSAGLLAGCLGSSDSGSGPGDGGAETTTTATTTETTTRTETESTTMADATVPIAERTLTVQHEYGALRDGVVSGGPPKDGIPSIDNPTFWTVDQADVEMADDAVVFGVVRNGEAKAYPQHVLVWHEICNDSLGGEPVSVTYCPLTGTAMGFRRAGVEFGVSGKLVNNNLVMYDRATDSRWPQMLGTAISGEHEGDSLQEFRLVWTTWANWREAHPDTKVLSEDTGYVRNYDQDPYGSYTPKEGYYRNNDTLFPRLAEDGRFSLKTVVVGARTPDGALAIPKFSLREHGVVAGELAGTPHLGVFDRELETAYVYRNPDGTTFEYDGEASAAVGPDGTSYAPADLPLERVYAFDAMWFAWAGFYPDTAVAEGGG